MEVKRPENEPIAAYREKNGSKPRGNLQGFFSRRALVFSPSAIASKPKKGRKKKALTPPCAWSKDASAARMEEHLARRNFAFLVFAANQKEHWFCAKNRPLRSPAKQPETK